MLEGALPTKLPSSVISAPAGVEVKLHFTVSLLTSETEAGTALLARSASEEFGCELDATAGASAAGATAYNCFTGLPFAFGYQTVIPCFADCALNVTPTGRALHLDHIVSTVQEMLEDFPVLSCTTIVWRTIAVLPWWQ
jgi:hypothetical protein